VTGAAARNAMLPSDFRDSMTEPQESRQSAFESALGELRAGRFEKAEVLCDQILTSAPRDPAAHQLAATIALRRGRLEEAARWAGSSLSLRPEHPPTLILAARVARVAGDFAQAKVWIARAARLAPDRPEAAFLTCVTLIESSDENARSVLEDLLLRFPNFVEGWREIAEALHKTGGVEAAVLAFARAAESSADPMDYARLGAALQTLNRPREAIVAFRNALNAAPNLAEARIALGACLRQAGELQLARVEFERALALRPSDGRAWFGLGLLCEDLRDTLGAIQAYRRSVEAQPDVPEGHVNLGLNLQNAGDLDAAMASYRRAVRLRPDTFGRVAQALTSAKKGRLWLNSARLRRSLEA
jgi:tetratricopeptide (TPR) repeat protein